jgi:hypothetical protein
MTQASKGAAPPPGLSGKFARVTGGGRGIRQVLPATAGMAG